MGAAADAEIDVSRLTREFAEAHADRIAELLSRIPLLEYTRDDVLAEVSSRGKPLMGKWLQSLVALADGKIVAVLIAYEKQADPPFYPEKSSYLSEIAVDEAWEGRGIARRLTELWLMNTAGSAPHSLQTNSSSENKSVISFYRRLGFEEVNRKQYDNRVDTMMFRY